MCLTGNYGYVGVNIIYAKCREHLASDPEGFYEYLDLMV